MEEPGRGLIAFGNIVTALVFFQSYWSQSNPLGFSAGVLAFLGFYITGMLMIHVSEKREENNNE